MSVLRGQLDLLQGLDGRESSCQSCISGPSMVFRPGAGQVGCDITLPFSDAKCRVC